MATQTFPHSGFNNGLVRIEYDVNMANYRVSKVRCINGSALPARAMIYQGGTLIFTADAPANQTTAWNTTGVQLVWDAVDGNIQMGNYILATGWPAG